MIHEDLLEQIYQRYREILGDNLTGIYVHGSIALGCFEWSRSDIDFIVMVKMPLHQQEKLQLLQVLEDLRPQAPPKGFEMSVVLEEYCRNFVYPTPYELHFSPAWLEMYLADPLGLCDDKLKTDYDLAAHFTIINKAGMPFGESPAVCEVFGEVPTGDYLDSIRLDVENAVEDVKDSPVYVILNLCRVYAFVRDGLVLSKVEGGEWGIRNLHPRYRTLIEGMIRNEGETDVELHGEFCGEMLSLIFG